MKYSLFLVFALSMAFSNIASAHHQEAERMAVLQLDEEGIHLLLEVSAHGKSATLLRATHDMNRDGQLDEAESSLLALSVARSMTRSLVVKVQGKVVKFKSSRARLASKEDRSHVVVMALLAADPLALKEEKELKFEVSTRPGFNFLISGRALGHWKLVKCGDHGIRANKKSCARALPVSGKTSVILSFSRKSGRR